MGRLMGPGPLLSRSGPTCLALFRRQIEACVHMRETGPCDHPGDLSPGLSSMAGPAASTPEENSYVNQSASEENMSYTERLESKGCASLSDG